jgi:beta-lactamase class A
MKKKEKHSSKKYSGNRRKTKDKKKDSLKQDLQKDVKKDTNKDVKKGNKKEAKEDTKKTSKKSVDQKATEETVVSVEHKEKEVKTETLALRSKRSKKSRSKSSRDDKKAYLILAFLGVLVILLFVAMLALAGRGKQASNTGSLGNIFGSNSKVTKKEDKEKEEKVTPTNKSAEAKQAVMEADADTMYGNGLYYDYANMTLSQVVEAFMADQGIESSQIAFSYKNTKTNEQYSMNDTQPMTAGSTYKLPLNMLVMDEVNKGKLSLTERFDITNTEYEYQGEHDNYVAAFGGSMTIPEMQEYSLVYSENTPAYALAERLGGMEKFYGMLDKYGKSKGEVKTIQMHGNKTTTDYYIQVLDYLWKHQEDYKDILKYLGESFPEYYYKTYNQGLTIYQKPGYVREALNVDAIVMEDTPYLIAIYTRYLGGSDEETSEINNVGLQQLEMLCYVINEWHRVNMN